MTRRSISLLPTVESAVRDFQADLLKMLDRDVTFTEALNLLLLSGMYAKVQEKVKQLGKEGLNTILDTSGAHTEAVLDNAFDEYVKALPKKN